MSYLAIKLKSIYHLPKNAIRFMTQIPPFKITLIELNKKWIFNFFKKLSINFIFDMSSFISVYTFDMQDSTLKHIKTYLFDFSIRYTFEVAPVFTLLEHELIENALSLVGYPKMPEGDGILCPGGSLSNMYGMILARYHYFPDVKRKGLSGLPPLAVFTSDDSHYSITKGAHWLGIGTDNIHKVSAIYFSLRLKTIRLKINTEFASTK